MKCKKETLLEIKRVKFNDALIYAFQILDFTYKNLCESSEKIIDDKRYLIDTLSYSWSFIDNLNRIRELIEGSPTISQNKQPYKTFLKTTKIVKGYRNYIQHLRSEIPNQEDTFKFPVWGSLSWIDCNDKNKCHSAILGTAYQGISYNGCVWDTQKNKFISKVCLSIQESTFNFDVLYKDFLSFKKKLNLDLQHKIPIFSHSFIKPT